MTARSVAGLAVVMTTVLASCGSPTAPGEITIDPALLEAVGDSVQLTVSPIGSSASWASLNPSVVTVSPSGMARALAPGLAVIQASRSGRTAEAEVRVLPSADVRATTVSLQPDGVDQERLTMQLVNHGGRGFYRFEAWQRVDGLPPIRVLNQVTETLAPVAMDGGYRTWLRVPTGEGGTGRSADFVVIYSRPANSEVFTSAYCALLHGEGPCIVPN